MSDTCRLAARGGHLDCLLCIGVIGPLYTCIVAVEGGYLYCLVWAREHGCPWNETICRNAAERGHLDILTVHGIIG